MSGAAGTGEKRAVAPGAVVCRRFRASCIDLIWSLTCAALGSGLSGTVGSPATTADRACALPFTRTSKLPASCGLAVGELAAQPGRAGSARSKIPASAGTKRHLLTDDDQGMRAPLSEFDEKDRKTAQSSRTRGRL